MQRAWPILLVILVLLLFASIAWLTHHPESAAVRQAESLPWIGPYATKFRRAYAPPPPPPPPVILRAPEPIRIVDLERQADDQPPWSGPPRYLWVLAGTEIFPEPNRASTPVERLADIGHLPRLGRRGDWFRVWRGGAERWIHLPDYDEDAPPLGTAPEPVLALPARQADVQRLDRARALLGRGAHELNFAGYRIYTDVWDSQLLGLVGRVIAQLESAYEAHFGLQLLGEPTGALVIYRHAGSLLRLQRLEGLTGLPSTGHAALGVAALAVGERPTHEVLSTLVHEVAHLMHRRAVGPALPPWLDEGLSDDLANLPIDGDGRLGRSGWGGRRLDGVDQVLFEGPLASLRVTRRALELGRAPTIEELVTYDWREFVVSPSSRLHYDLAAFFVRYLLESPDHADVFRGFLRATAAGEPIDTEDLRRRLGRTWPEIQADFTAWIERQAQVTAPRAPTAAAASERRRSAPGAGA